MFSGWTETDKQKERKKGKQIHILTDRETERKNDGMLVVG